LSNDEIAAGVGRADSPAADGESGNVALNPPVLGVPEKAAPDPVVPAGTVEPAVPGDEFAPVIVEGP